MNILVVDDSPDLLALLKVSLEAMGHNIQLAKDGIEALSFVKNNKQFDVIISDFEIPKMNGIELRFELQKYFEECPPFILFTNNDSRFDFETYAKYLYAIVKKSINFQVLFRYLIVIEKCKLRQFDNSLIKLIAKYISLREMDFFQLSMISGIPLYRLQEIKSEKSSVIYAWEWIQFCEALKIPRSPTQLNS